MHNLWMMVKEKYNITTDIVLPYNTRHSYKTLKLSQNLSFKIMKLNPKKLQEVTQPRINSLAIFIIALALVASTMSILWNPTWSKRASTCTPHLTNMVTNSCCRSTMMSPLYPTTRHFTTFLTLLRCGPFTIGLQYLWSRSVSLGKAKLHNKSNTGKGNNWSVAYFNSDPVLFSPPNMGWFKTMPRILNGFKSTSATYIKAFRVFYYFMYLFCMHA